mgnify:CR=1 FL=1
MSLAAMAPGFFAPWCIYALVLALHLVLPARRVVGYAVGGRGEPLRYRLNGILVALALMSAWAGLGWLGYMPWDWLWQTRWEGLAGACTLGLLFTAWIVSRAPSRGRPLVVELFLGRLDNPQWFSGRVDAKMLLYLVGAIMLALNLLSFGAHHWLRHPDDPSPGVLLHLLLFIWFIFDYLTFERVHLYTYDLFAEKVGFKLGWGCLVFYPYFYAIGLWSVAELPNPGTPTALLVIYALVFFAGWALARGANMQKFNFKLDPTRSFLGMAPRTLGDGQRSLLCSGFWGISRHVNYLGEILMATGLTLALGWPGVWWAWLYPLYYVALLTTRERADERRCAAKYGPLWDRYREQVPRRIVPGLY